VLVEPTLEGLDQGLVGGTLSEPLEDLSLVALGDDRSGTGTQELDGERFATRVHQHEEWEVRRLLADLVHQCGYGASARDPGGGDDHVGFARIVDQPTGAGHLETMGGGRMQAHAEDARRRGLRLESLLDRKLIQDGRHRCFLHTS